MRCFSLGAIAFAFALMLLGPRAAIGQALLPTKGWGSLSGTVTLDGKVAPPANLVPRIMGNPDKVCCLAGKPNELVDQTWVVDPKTNGVANVMVWIKAPKGMYFPTHDKYKVRKDTVLIDQPNCAFVPRVAGYQRFYINAGNEVETGQTLLVKNSSVVNHNIRAIGSPGKNDGFNVNLPAGTDLDISKKPDAQKLKPQQLPVMLECNVHPWMSAKLFVFDHPYYAVTKEDGSYEIPIVPAGAEVGVVAWHEGVGWVMTKNGQPLTIQEGKNTLDFKVKAP